MEKYCLSNPKKMSEKYGNYVEFDKIVKKTKDYSLSINNAIFSQNFFVSRELNKNRHGLNTFLLGAAGTGKDRFFIEPNLLQMNRSFLVIDPNKALYKTYADLMWKNGYIVKVLDIGKFEDDSDSYNPLSYCNNEVDVFNLINYLINSLILDNNNCDILNYNNTSFYKELLELVISTIIGFLVLSPKGDSRRYSEIPEIIGDMGPLEPNLTNVYFLLKTITNKWTNKSNIKLNNNVKLEKNKFYSEFDILFENLLAYEKSISREILFTYSLYERIKKFSYETLEKMVLEIEHYFSFFDLEKFKKITIKDTMNLKNISEEKTVIFVCVSTMDRTYQFLANLIISQLIDILFKSVKKEKEKIVLPNGELVKTINKEEFDNEKINNLLRNYAESSYKKVEDLSYKDKKNKYDGSYYEIIGKDGGVITRKLREEDAKNYVSMLKKAYVKNSSYRLAIETNLILNEFPSLGYISNLINSVPVMRPYGISVTIVCQSIEQIKGIYAGKYDTLIANCPYFVYFGTSSQSDIEYVLNKMEALNYAYDIMVNSNRKVTLNDFINYMRGEKELEINKNDVYKLLVEKCIICLHGELPIIDDKYDIKNHRFYNYIVD